MLGPSSLLDRELGLGSLERVELLARLEAEFGVRLPDRVAAEVNTPEELAQAVVEAPGAGALDRDSPAVRAAVTAEKLHRQAAEEGLAAAQTLIEVLRYRALH